MTRKETIPKMEVMVAAAAAAAAEVVVLDLKIPMVTAVAMGRTMTRPVAPWHSPQVLLPAGSKRTGHFDGVV